MKSAAGVFIQPVHDVASAGLPQWARIAHAVRQAAAHGAVAHGQRLPSARQLAQDWRVSRGAVDDAFAQLELEGLVERRVGDGTYLRGAVAAAAAARQPALPALDPRGTDLDDFPLETWRRLLLAAHDPPQRTLLDGAPPGGLPALREAIARHLAIHRGLSCLPGQVLVVNGAGEAMQLVARLLLARGDTVWIEHPCDPALPALMQSMGLRVQGVPLDAGGLDVAAGERLAPQATLCCLHPTTQFPLGVRTSAERGADLLRWAERTGAWIVEGQQNDELLPPSQQPASLLSRDVAGRVLLLGSFEGIAFPSLRVAYLVLPPALAADFIATAQFYGDHVSAPLQWALAQFIDRGHMTAHLQALRQRRARRRERVQRSLLTTLPPGVRAGPLHSGLHLCLHLPRQLVDTAVCALLREQGLGVEALSRCAWQPHLPGEMNGIVLGYGGLGDAALEQALRLLGRTLAALGAAGYQPTGQNT